MEDEEELKRSAETLEAAVVAILDPIDAARQQTANQWLTCFLSEPRMWTVALYLAFPPEGSTLGRLSETRFFVLNLLLSKLRSDWSQLDQDDAQEIFEVLVRQLPKNLDDRTVAARLCIVLSAAAALAGPQACHQVVNFICDHSDQSMLLLKLELLAALAEETLHRSRALPWEVENCMQSCCSRVLLFLQAVNIAFFSFEVQAKSLVCLERWIQAGVTLSELFSDHQSLFTSILNAMRSEDEICAIAACNAISELVAAVDLLPARDAAVKAVISAVLRCKYIFTSSNPGRSHALCSLITAIGCAESSLILRGGTEELLILDWILEATGGGGGLGVVGASMAAEVWPRLASTPSGQLPRIEIFQRAAQAILNVAVYPADGSDNDGDDEDDLLGFRLSMAQDALAACLKELGSKLLEYIYQKLSQCITWQEAEVQLYAVSSLSQQISTILSKDVSYQDYDAATNLLVRVLRGDPATPSLVEKVSEQWPHGKLVETAVTVIKAYAGWIADDLASLEKSVQYTLVALRFVEAKRAGAEALRELCRVSAPHLAAARAVSLLMGSCEQAIATSLGGMQSEESVALIGGLAAVAAALPQGEAEATIASLTVSAVTTVKELCAKEELLPENASCLVTSLKLVTTVLDFGVGPNAHPAIPVIHEIWSSLDMLAARWAGNMAVASALCDLWRMLATKVGVMMQNVLPKVISIVTDMFKKHLLSSCIDCLSSIVALASTSDAASAEVENCMTAALHDIAAAIGALEVLMEQQLVAKESGHSAMDSLGAICTLTRVCVRSVPSSVTPALFQTLFRCGIGLLQRGDSEPAVSAATLLSESIFGGSLDETGRYALAPELQAQVERILALSTTPLVETVLRLVAHGQFTPAFQEVLVDVLYSLLIKRGPDTEAAMLAFLKSSKFPARPGILKDYWKEWFVKAAYRAARRSRKMFQALMADFSRVCQALCPAEVLQEYYGL